MEDFGTLYNTFKTVTKNRNKVSIDKFIKFIPLYKKYTDEEFQQQKPKLEKLAEEFKTTFDLYEPIEIYDPSMEKLLIVLPPVLNYLNTLDERIEQAHSILAKMPRAQFPAELQQYAYQFLETLMTVQEEDIQSVIKNFILMQQSTKQLQELKKNIQETEEESSVSTKNIANLLTDEEPTNTSKKKVSIIDLLE